MKKTVSLFVLIVMGIIMFAYIVYAIPDAQLHQGLLYALLGIHLLQVALAGFLVYTTKKLRGKNEFKINTGC